MLNLFLFVTLIKMFTTFRAKCLSHAELLNFYTIEFGVV